MRSVLLMLALAAPAVAQPPDLAANEKVLKAAGWEGRTNDELKTAEGPVPYTVVKMPDGLTLDKLKKLPPLPTNYAITLPDQATDEWVAAVAARKDRDKMVAFSLPVAFKPVNITDKVAEHLPKFTNLVLLSFGSESKVGNKALTALPKLTKLRVLSLAKTMTDPGLAALAPMTKLEKLYIYESPVGDAGMKHVAKLTGLKELRLTTTKVGDAGVKEIVGLQLVELTLRDSKVTDAGVKLLADHSTLRELSVSYSKDVTDAGLKSVAGNSALKNVSAVGTKVTKEYVAELKTTRPELFVLR